MVVNYARKHDEAIWKTFCATVGVGAETHSPQGADNENIGLAHRIATLSGARGVLGLTSAERTPEAAYWASWVDVLSVFNRNSHPLVILAVETLSGERSETTCASEATQVRGLHTFSVGHTIATYLAGRGQRRAGTTTAREIGGWLPSMFGSDMLALFQTQYYGQHILPISSLANVRCFYHKGRQMQVRSFGPFRPSAGLL